MKYFLLFTLCFVALAFAAKPDNHYQEFQIGVDSNDDRDTIWDDITGTFLDKAGLSVANANELETDIRSEKSSSFSTCGGSGFFRVRNYLEGSRAGLVTLDVKSSGAKSKSEAEDEPYDCANEFQNVCDWSIEEDFHPCLSDFAGNGRILLDQEPSIDNCNDLLDYFPDLFDRNSKTFDLGDESITWVRQQYITDPEFSVCQYQFQLTVQYDSQEDAETDTNPGGTEWSVTILNASNGCIDKVTEIYVEMLKQYTGDNCSVNDFQGGSSGSTGSSGSSNASSGSSNNNSSNSSVSLVPSLLMGCLAIVSLLVLM